MKKVLVVDDDADIRKTLVKILTKERYHVIAVNNAKEGIETLKSDDFDLVLIDMFMPGMSGRDMFEHIRKEPRFKDTKVIFLTVAKFSESGKEDIEEMGISDYITKPFDIDDLVKRVKKALQAKKL